MCDFSLSDGRNNSTYVSSKKEKKNDIKIVIMTIMFYISFRLYDIIQSIIDYWWS